MHLKKLLVILMIWVIDDESNTSANDKVRDFELKDARN